MDETKRALEVAERMHALAATPTGALLTLAELERLAEEEVELVRERLVQAREREPR